MGTRWGISRSTAMVHGYLYLCNEWETADDICEALGLARSNVSTSLRELEDYRLVYRGSVLGERKSLYRAEYDVWEMGRGIACPRPVLPMPPALGFAAACLIGKWQKDVMLTWDEVRGLCEGRLAVAEAGIGRRSLAAWIQAHADTLGRRYERELARR